LKIVIIKNMLRLQRTSGFMIRGAILPFALLSLVISVESTHASSAVAHASNSHLVASIAPSVEVAKRRAVETCRRQGGVNVEIIAATDRFGYGAIAVAARGTGSVIGVSLGNRSASEADLLAIQRCLKMGGKSPRVIRAWKG
jgi:hypothetical protein